MAPTYREAIDYYRSDENEKAKPIFDSLISATPLNYKFSMFQGMVCARLNDFDLGIKQLQFAFKNAYFRNEKQNVFYTFANYYSLKGDLDYAISYLKEAVRLGLITLNTWKKMRI